MLRNVVNCVSLPHLSIHKVNLIIIIIKRTIPTINSGARRVSRPKRLCAFRRTSNDVAATYPRSNKFESLSLSLSLSHTHTHSLSLSLSLAGEYASPSLYSSCYFPRIWPFLLYFFERFGIWGGSYPRLHRSSIHSLQYLIDCGLDWRFPSTYLSLLPFCYYLATVHRRTTWLPACRRITPRLTRCPLTFVQ